MLNNIQMKSKYILLLLLLSFSSIVLAENNKMYDKYSEMKGVTSVYISKSMLQLISNFDMKFDGLDISKISSKLTGIYILTTEDPAIASRMKKDTERVDNNKRYEPLMKVKDDESDVVFYTLPKNKEVIKEMIVLVNEKSEFVMIQLLGEMTLDDIRQIIKKK